MSHQIGSISSTEHGTSYWIRDAGDIESVSLTGVQYRIARWTNDKGQQSLRIDVDGIFCEPKPGLGLRPKSPIVANLKLVGGKKKETLVLA